MKKYLKDNWPVISLLITVIFALGMNYQKLDSLDTRVSRIENALIKQVALTAK